MNRQPKKRFGSWDGDSIDDSPQRNDQTKLITGSKEIVTTTGAKNPFARSELAVISEDPELGLEANSIKSSTNYNINIGMKWILNFFYSIVQHFFDLRVGSVPETSLYIR